MRISITSKWLVAASIFVGAATISSTAQAESYAGLTSKGFKTGKMSRRASGAQGWVVSNGEKKYFCRLAATMAYVGNTGMVGFTSAGKQIGLDRKTFEASLGRPLKNIPQLSALKAGKPSARDVGACNPSK